MIHRVCRSSKDARLAFYQTADAKKMKYDDLAPQIATEVDPECLEALIKLVIAMVEVRIKKRKKLVLKKDLQSK